MVPPFFYSFIPCWDKQNGGVEIPYYQQFEGFPLYFLLEDYREIEKN
jgi:hypothetical protein